VCGLRRVFGVFLRFRSRGRSGKVIPSRKVFSPRRRTVPDFRYAVLFAEEANEPAPIFREVVP
jgi:hypothetical protein